MDGTKDTSQCFPRSNFLSPEDAVALTRKHQIPSHTGHASPGPSTYHVLSCLCILANLTTAGIIFVRWDGSLPEKLRHSSATALSTNLCVSIAIRNDHVINMISQVACSLPHRAPLCMRKIAAKVYCYGGIHSGCAIAGFFWYIIFAGTCLLGSERTPVMRSGMSFISGIALLLLTTILVFSHPSVRARSHNAFEITHRFLGWGFMGTLWVHVILVNLTDPVRSNDKYTVGQRLVLDAPFWLLVISTLLLIYPWTRLRLCSVHTEKLSDRVLRLEVHGIEERPCMTRRLATTPLRETHAFATIPNKDGVGYSIYMSAAGDWTKRVIREIPEKMWIKGCPTLGATYSSKLFTKVLFVATGSAILPVLSAIQSRSTDQTAVLWVTADPLRMFDTKLLQELNTYRKNITIIERSRGEVEPEEICSLIYALHQKYQSEAVFVVSNRLITDFVKRNLGRNNVPVFGPIFDS